MAPWATDEHPAYTRAGQSHRRVRTRQPDGGANKADSFARSVRHSLSRECRKSASCDGVCAAQRAAHAMLCAQCQTSGVRTYAARVDQHFYQIHPGHSELVGHHSHCSQPKRHRHCRSASPLHVVVQTACHQPSAAGRLDVMAMGGSGCTSGAAVTHRRNVQHPQFAVAGPPCLVHLSAVQRYCHAVSSVAAAHSGGAYATHVATPRDGQPAASQALSLIHI